MDQAMLPGMENTLPLLSGTPMQAARKDPQPAANVPAKGQSSFASCRPCKDTGPLKDAHRLHYCWRAAGVAAREEDREKGRSIDEVTVSTVRENFAGIVSMRDNWVPEDDEWRDWENALKLGRDYLVGSRVPMGRFLRSYRSRLNAWQQVAFVWAQQHPDRLLVLDGHRRTWHVYKRARYVSFRLPFHDAGGERTYISQDGHWKIHVDED